MRIGYYAMVDGIEYKASPGQGRVALFLPQTSPRPQGWTQSGRTYWRTTVPETVPSEVFVVRTFATFQGLCVEVHQVRDDGTVWVTHQSRYDAPPPHPAFTKDPDPGISALNAIVPLADLTDLGEEIKRFPTPPLPPDAAASSGTQPT